MAKRDYYEVLGIPRTASEDEIKRAFRRLAMKLHPDRNPGDQAAEERFKEAKEAYDVLSDQDRRRLYDQYGHAAFEHGVGAGRAGPDLGDLFGDIFGDIFGAGRARERRGADLRYVIELDLEEAVFGVTREIRIPGLVDCEACDGTGSADRKSRACGTCRGHGRVRMQNGIFSIQQTCPACGGRGQVPADPCRACHGNGRVERERTLEVRIPAGVDEGDRIRLAGEGEAGHRGTPPGDLYIDVRVRPHPIFARDGDDLHCEIPIRFSQAALGAEIVVPTLDGEARITIPPETQTGRQFRLRGKGVKSVRSRAPGDLICRVVVETPVNLTARQRELLEAFEATFDDEGRAHQPRQSSWFDGVKQFWERVTG